MKALATLTVLGGVTWLMLGFALIETAETGPQALQGLMAGGVGLALLALSGALLAKIASR